MTLCTRVSLASCSKAKKRKSFVSGYPTDPNILGAYSNFFEAFRDIEFFFRLFFKDFNTLF